MFLVSFIIFTFLCNITLSTHCYFYTIPGQQSTITGDNDGTELGSECLLTYGINITYYKFINNNNNAWTATLDHDGVLTLQSLIKGYRSTCELICS